MALSQQPDVTAAAYRGPVVHLSAIDWIALVLLIVGAINWGLVAVLNLDLVAAIFGSMTTASRVVYLLVALAGIYGIVLAAKWARRP
jgi:uncharacterized protein